MYTICEITNINVDFRIFVNAGYSIFLKKKNNTKTQIKLRLSFLENCGHTFVENAMILAWAKLQRKILSHYYQAQTLCEYYTTHSLIDLRAKEKKNQ